jgi:hypothetical protein
MYVSFYHLSSMVRKRLQTFNSLLFLKKAIILVVGEKAGAEEKIESLFRGPDSSSFSVETKCWIVLYINYHGKATTGVLWMAESMCQDVQLKKPIV